MTDYERIAEVIRYIDEHRVLQPDLAELAAVVGLSESHFHRLFSSWAGITPKDFLQCLTLEDARRRLLEGNSVLDAALGAGLSGPGRLHDLCVNFEAASPGEIKSGGVGWQIRGGISETPFGLCLIAESPRGICHLSFFQPLEFSNHWSKLETHWPKAEFVRDDAWAKDICCRIFQEGHRSRGPRSPREAPFRLFVKGSSFQVKVWQALLRIPEGLLVSYGSLAELVGNPKASRAVGSAVGSNPIAFLIPCHRVIRETGAPGGYAWGLERKRAIWAWEASA